MTRVFAEGADPLRHDTSVCRGSRSPPRRRAGSPTMACQIPVSGAGLEARGAVGPEEVDRDEHPVGLGKGQPPPPTDGDGPYYDSARKANGRRSARPCRPSRQLSPRTWCTR